MLSSVRIATFRGVQEAERQRRGARVKEEELEVNVSIWIEEQLPDDHEIMGIAETRHVADQPKPNFFNYCKISETLLRDGKVIAIGKSKSQRSWVSQPKTQDGRVTAENCTQESVRQGLKSAIITAVIAAVPTLVAVTAIPWAKANINHTGQALIISGASVAAYFITADKTILKAAKKNASYDRTA